MLRRASSRDQLVAEGLGELGEFGELLREISRVHDGGIFLAALALIVALNMIEQIPNSSMSSWNWLLAGALLGRAEYLQLGVRQAIFAPEKRDGLFDLFETV